MNLSFGEIFSTSPDAFDIIDCRSIRSFRFLHLPHSRHFSMVDRCVKQPLLIGDTPSQLRRCSAFLDRIDHPIFCTDSFSSVKELLFSRFNENFPLQILAGKTGCGKSAVLQSLKSKGEQIIDLEESARHAGSVFGKLISCDPQPSLQQFRLNIAWQLSGMNKAHPVWMEQKPRAIGSVSLPDRFLQQIETSPHYLLEETLEKRTARILTLYGTTDSGLLISLSAHIAQRLDTEAKNRYEHAVKNHNLEDLCLVLLQYYDSVYEYYLKKVHCQKFTPCRKEFIENSFSNSC